MFHRNNIFHLKYAGNDLSNQSQHRVLASGNLTALKEKPRITEEITVGGQSASYTR